LLDPNAERYFGLDNVGTRFWQLLHEHGGDLEKIVTVMLDEYDVDEATLRHDLGGLIGRLAAEGLVLEEPAR
jgi:hypothetical protein